MPTTPAFVVSGEEYPIPDLGSVTMNEAIIFESYANMTLDEFYERDGLTAGALAALLHIAIVRKSPLMKDKAIRELVGNAELLPLLESLNDTIQEPGDEVVDPLSAPASGSGSEDGSRTGQGSEPQTSGPGSESTGAHLPDEDPSLTGTPV